MKTKKTAKAVRIDGDVYDVFYPDGAMDRRVSSNALRKLVADGYEVTVDQRTHRGDGEPATYTLRAKD